MVEKTMRKPGFGRLWAVVLITLGTLCV